LRTAWSYTPLTFIGIGTWFLYTVAFRSLIVATIWCTLAVQAKRSHDLNRSGYWVLIHLLPIAGSLFALVELGFNAGTEGENRYGEDPLEPGRLAAIERQKAGKRSPGGVIDFEGANVVDADLAPLIDNPDIAELRLGGTHVTDAGLDYVAHLTGLRILDLSLTAVTDAGLDQLHGLTSLSQLWLGGTQLSDGGLLALASLRNLQQLHIANTRVTPAGIQQFESRLPGCRVYP